MRGVAGTRMVTPARDRVRLGAAARLGRRLGVLGMLVLAGLALLASVAAAASPPLNESAPAISGSARDGQRLKASKGAWSSQEPLDYGYQWSRCGADGAGCEAISGAARATYRVVSADVGHTLRVAVTATGKDSEAHTTASSAPSAQVQAAAPARHKAAGVTGNPEDGQLLTAGTGSWKGTQPMSYAYQWQACTRSACEAVPGATEPEYRPVTSQIGSKIRVVVTATNAAGSASAASRATKAVRAGPPVAIAPPTIAGGLQEGLMLTASPGTWVGTGPLGFGYEWKRCSALGGGCEAIAGATEPTYEISPLDLASKLEVVVRATGAAGAASATSAETQPVLGILPSNTVLPSIGGVLQEGGLLSVGTGSWSGSAPIEYGYQWQLCNAVGAACVDIAEATGSTLPLSVADIGKTLDVVVTATNVAGSTSVASSVTGLIAGILPSNTVLPSIGGVLQEGGLLSVGTGSWSGSAPIEYGYQWQLCNAVGAACVDIAEATGSTLPLSVADIGKTLDVVVTATNVAGSTSVASSVTGLIAGILPSNTVLPSIGGVLQEGGLLSVGTGSWSVRRRSNTAISGSCVMRWVRRVWISLKRRGHAAAVCG